jgi:EAL domain-containing protein (putative c-di-GMP-specific phosphodiesterase class I)
MRARPDVVKIDRSLVAGVESDHAKAAVVDSFVRFAARTGAAVCAEGVESAAELRALSELDVTYGQGFGIARPAAPWAGVAPWVPASVRTSPLVALPGLDVAG